MGLVLATFSGLVTALALPNELFPDGSALLGAIAVVPYFLALAGAHTLRDASRMGALYGAVSTLASNYWLAFFEDFSVWTLGGTTLGYTLIHAFLAVVLVRFLREERPWRPFAVAAAWTAYEYLKSVGFLAYPWGLLAYPPSNILVYVQHVEITGIWSLSFLTAAVNAVFAEPLLRLRSGSAPTFRRAIAAAGRQGAVVAVLIALAVGFGVWRFADPLPVAGHVNAVLVQQNIDQWRAGQEEPSLRRGQELTREALRETAQLPDLVAWSETSLQRPYPRYQDFYRTHPAGDPFMAFLREIDTPFLSGAPVALDAENRELMNGAVLLSPSGRLIDYYGKQHLVPMAENIPFWNFGPVREFFRNVIGITGRWSVGTEYTLFEIPVADPGVERVRFGAPICFEDSFGYLTRGFVYLGADVLVNLTNNAWSRTDSAQIQHFVSARFRAIENRRSLARSTNSGLTTVIDAYGRVIAELPMFESDALVAEIPVYGTTELTIYARHSDWLGKLMLGVTVVLAAGMYLRDRAPALRQAHGRGRRKSAI
ncbi:MAG: apolipoprotein N-acyltransferase [Spirochaetaceae bacterium]